MRCPSSACCGATRSCSRSRTSDSWSSRCSGSWTRWRSRTDASSSPARPGSGKSTTLYAAINKTNDPKSNLITVEDPVEYRLEGLSQVQVHERAGLTFAAALRSILRQDPDKVMIGEIRDKETGTIAIEAALTGHLVLSTLHTNDAPSAITRLTEMGIEPFLSASAVNCVLAQRLGTTAVPGVQGGVHARRGRAESASSSRSRRGELPTLYRAVGCKKCNNIGYKGRMGIHEVMVMSEALERMCVEHASADELKRQAVAEGMLTLRDDGYAKVRMGLTSHRGDHARGRLGRLACRGRDVSDWSLRPKCRGTACQTRRRACSRRRVTGRLWR